MVARRHPLRSPRSERRPVGLRRWLQLTTKVLQLPWGAWISQPGRPDQPLLLNPIQFSRHWRVVQLERCLQLSSSTVRRR